MNFMNLASNRVLLSLIASCGASLLLLTFSGCGGSGGSGQPAPGTAGAKEHGHDHDHDHDHGTDHAAAAEKHDDHGGMHKEGEEAHVEDDASPLGSQSIAGFAVSATQHGKVVAGQESHFDLSVTPESGATGSGAIAAVRVWIGAADAVGSMKAKADGEPAHLHVHVEAPATLGATSKLWVELEFEGGGAAGRKTVSFDLKR